MQVFTHFIVFVSIRFHEREKDTYVGRFSFTLLNTVEPCFNLMCVVMWWSAHMKLAYLRARALRLPQAVSENAGYGETWNLLNWTFSSRNINSVLRLRQVSRGSPRPNCSTFYVYWSYPQAEPGEFTAWLMMVRKYIRKRKGLSYFCRCYFNAAQTC